MLAGAAGAALYERFPLTCPHTQRAMTDRLEAPTAVDSVPDLEAPGNEDGERAFERLANAIDATLLRVREEVDGTGAHLGATQRTRELEDTDATILECKK